MLGPGFLSSSTDTIVMLWPFAANPRTSTRFQRWCEGDAAAFKNKIFALEATLIAVKNAKHFSKIIFFRHFELVKNLRVLGNTFIRQNFSIYSEYGFILADQFYINLKKLLNLIATSSH